MGGNGVVLHPSPLAALAGERIARAFARAGLPEGLLQVVHGDPETARALVSAPDIAHVRFTGSSQAGRDVGEACARELKRATIEVGGKDPMLVLADANMPRAVGGAVWGAFANAGQSGGSLARAYVLRERHDRFLAGVVVRARARCASATRASRRPRSGRCWRADRVERLVAFIDEAVAGGATLHCGGPVSVRAQRRVLRAGRADRRAGRCAPAARGRAGAVACGRRPSKRAGGDRALQRGHRRRLGASVWTADEYKGARIAHEIRAGMVWMNDHVVSRTEPQLPWGAVHGSGIGRARGAARCARASSRSSSPGTRPAGGWRGGSPTTARSSPPGARSRGCARCATPTASAAGARGARPLARVAGPRRAARCARR